MPPLEDEDKFTTSTDNFKNVAGDGTTAADTVLVEVEVSHVAQLTSVRITGANTEIYDVLIRNQDGTSPSIEKTLVGSDIDDGNFEDPVIPQVGAQKEVVITNQEQLADANYGISIRVDELERGTEG